MTARSVLFGPAQRLDFIEKFVRAGADIGVLDLEDATAETAKGEARDAVRSLRKSRAQLEGLQLFVRINPLGSPHFSADLKAVAESGATGIMVPKIEADTEMHAVKAALREAGLGDALLCAGIESVPGVYRAAEICGAHPDLVYFGAEDFITDMGGVRTESNHEVAYARAHVVLAARLANVDALDQVVTDFHDVSRFEREANEARQLGFVGKLCIHPSQVSLANAAFTPTPEDLLHARKIVEAADSAEASGSGVIAVDGAMVDAPIIIRARRLLASWEEADNQP